VNVGEVSGEMLHWNSSGSEPAALLEVFSALGNMATCTNMTAACNLMVVGSVLRRLPPGSQERRFFQIKMHAKARRDKKEF
jgi:hypothetical protein